MGCLAAIPNSRLIVYEGAGHTLHWEDPARCAADLSTFLQRALHHQQASVTSGEATSM